LLQKFSLHIQDPPRITRSVPVSGPRGSRAGLRR